MKHDRKEALLICFIAWACRLVVADTKNEKNEQNNMGQNEISNDEWWVVVYSGCCGDQSNREAEQDKRENDIKQIDIK